MTWPLSTSAISYSTDYTTLIICYIPRVAKHWCWECLWMKAFHVIVSSAFLFHPLYRFINLGFGLGTTLPSLCCTHLQPLHLGHSLQASLVRDP